MSFEVFFSHMAHVKETNRQKQKCQILKIKKKKKKKKKKKETGFTAGRTTDAGVTTVALLSSNT